MPTTTTNKTTKIGLSQYVGSDIVTFLTNYNSDMKAIDDAIGAANGIAGLDANGKLKQMPTPSDIGAVPTSLKINGYSLTGDRTLTTSDIGAATSAQGLKADNAVQGVQVNGTDLTADSNKKVNVTLTGLGGVASSILGTANGVAVLPSTLPTSATIAKIGTDGHLSLAVEGTDYLAPHNTTVTATSTFSNQVAKVSRVGNVVAVTAPMLTNYTTPGGYPAYCTLPDGYRPSDIKDIVIAIDGSRFANIQIAPNGTVSVGILGPSGEATFRLNFTFVI